MLKKKLISDLIREEHERQKKGLALIASENFVSDAVLAAAGSVLTNKYAEGYPGNRYYAGCTVVDCIEKEAIRLAKKLFFDAAWANVQPHSGSQANAAVLQALLKPGDPILGLNLAHGGHLTHGSSVNFSGTYYKAYHYGVTPETGSINLEEVEKLALKVKPKLIICGASSYTQDWDYQSLRIIADKVGALLLADIAHTAGLIVAGLLNNPLPYAHVITTTTHKTLRGPRGGMILMGKDFPNPFGKKNKKGEILPLSKLIDLALFPGTQGGPLMQVIAAKAVAFEEALAPSFKTYAHQVLQNANCLAEALMQQGFRLVGGGTKNHLILIDLTPTLLTGKIAEKRLERAHITVNKNLIPFDKRSPFVTSGIRLGTAAITTRGLCTKEMKQIASWITRILTRKEERVIQEVGQELITFMSSKPLFSNQWL